MSEGIQESTLKLLKSQQINVKIYLINGIHIDGFIKAFDPYVVVVEDEKQQKACHKHHNAIPKLGSYFFISMVYPCSDTTFVVNHGALLVGE